MPELLIVITAWLPLGNGGVLARERGENAPCAQTIRRTQLSQCIVAWVFDK